MRIQLESPNSGVHTTFTPAIEGDVLMEDVLMVLEQGFLEEDDIVMNGNTVESDDAESATTSDQPLSDLGIKTSEELIKRLKSKDEIDANGKSKIHVALAAFKDTHVPVPKKIFLLTDWILDTIVKNAKELPSYKLVDLNMDRRVLGELLVPENYWRLLARCAFRLEPSEIVLLANRYPLIALLQSYVYFLRISIFNRVDIYEHRTLNSISNFFHSIKAARTSKQVQQIDVLNNCLASWLLASPLLVEKPYFTVDDKQALDDYINQNLEYLEMVLSLWLAESSKANNIKKVQDFFLSELLPLQTQALCWIRDESGIIVPDRWLPLFDIYRAILHRISYQSLIAPDQLNDTRQVVLEAIRNQKSSSSLIFASTYLSQLCLYRKDKQLAKIKSWTKEGEWRREIFQSFIQPAIEIMIPSTVTMPADEPGDCEEMLMNLDLLLSTATKWSLHYSDDGLSWRTLLERIFDFVTMQHSRVIPEPEDFGEDFRMSCEKVLVTIHELDESIIVGERHTKAILCALHHDACEKDELLKNLCTTSIKSRVVVGFVNSSLDALEEAVKRHVKAALSNRFISQKLIDTILFQEQYWQQYLGVALRDFISVEDVALLLNSVQIRLEKSFSHIYAFSAVKKRKESGSSPEDQTDNRRHLFSLAILQTYFASALVNHMAIPYPAYEAAQECISSLHVNLIQKFLNWALPRDNDPCADALATAVLILHGSIQQAAMACGNAEQDDPGTWNKLAAHWDLDLSIHHSVLSSIPNRLPKRSLELRLQSHLSIMHLIGRAFERDLSTPFDNLLSQIGGLTSLGRELFQDSCVLVRTSSQFPHYVYSISHLHGVADKGLERTAAWNLLISPYLPIFEQKASKEVLSRISEDLLWLMKLPDKPDRSWNFQSWKSSWKLSLSNARNLELPRWRERLCAALKIEIEKPEVGTETEVEQHKVVELLDIFPSDWLPNDLKIMQSEHKSAATGKPDLVKEVNYTVDTSLGLIAFSFCLIQNGDETTTKPQSSGYDLATCSRRATQQEYEDELDLLLKVLDRCGEKEIDAVGAVTNNNTVNLDNIDLLARCSPRAVLQTIAILLCNSPEGTLLVSQRCLTGVITSLMAQILKEDKVNRANKAKDFFEQLSHSTGLASIQFIETVLSTKPILFRSADISAIFTIAAEILISKCSLDTPFANRRTRFFTSISMTLIECIRLRRDYVSQYLPQMMMLLVKMLQVFQSVKKSKKESNEKNLLGLEEAKIFSRLLSTITAKSTSISIGGLPESKMKSLAKSFSTHAPYVIVAFVRNMTSSTFAKGEIREELIRGIYELCDIVGPWQKNVMMDMLADEGERIVMRSLWRGWEGQRYKGA